jgi:hypothetical protein
MKDREQKQGDIDLYVIDTVQEQIFYDVVRRVAVDKATFEKYFPDWKYKNNSRPKL